jgi:hypothetical protein
MIYHFLERPGYAYRPPSGARFLYVTDSLKDSEPRSLVACVLSPCAAFQSWAPETH